MGKALSLRERALTLLARREHGRAELRRKLAPHACAEEVESLLDELSRQGWLSDVRFAESLVRAKGARVGSLAIAHTLRQRGVPEALVQSQLAALSTSELERAREVWRRRFGSPPRDARERARQMRFLQGRGFPLEVILRVVRPGSEEE